MNKKGSGLGGEKNEQPYQGMPSDGWDDQDSQLSDARYYAMSDNPVPIEVLEIELFSKKSTPQKATEKGQENVIH